MKQNEPQSRNIIKEKRLSQKESFSPLKKNGDHKLIERIINRLCQESFGPRPLLTSEKIENDWEEVNQLMKNYKEELWLQKLDFYLEKRVSYLDINDKQQTAVIYGASVPVGDNMKFEVALDNGEVETINLYDIL